MEITRKSFEEILGNAKSAALSNEACEALAGLEELLQRAGEKLRLEDLNACKASVVWNGLEDVLFVMDELMEAECGNLDEETRMTVAKSATESIDWESDSFVSCENGNDRILDAVELALAARGLI